MPQTKPMSWNILFLTMNTMLILMLIKMHFNTILSKPIKIKYMLMNNKMNWMHKW